MIRFRLLPLMVLLAALLPLSLALVTPRAAIADTTPFLDGRWYFHDESGNSIYSQPFNFVSSGDVEITVTDFYCIGDVFEVFDNGTSLGTTSPVVPDCAPQLLSGTPEDAIAAGFSSGVFTVGAGSHVITFVPVQQVGFGDDWQLFVKFDGETIVGPHWEVRAKIGGGNLYNAFLPDYTPGEWATKNVGVYLFCVPGDAPIDLLRADRSVIFKDGEHTYSTKPTDECIDENGLAAEPIVEWGPIMVDTKAPVCRFTPSTIYVPRNTENTQVTFATELSDETSGLGGIGASYAASGGAVFHEASLSDPNLFVSLGMGPSTAGRVEATLFVSDNAGNLTFCKATVRAK